MYTIVHLQRTAIMQLSKNNVYNSIVSHSISPARAGWLSWPDGMVTTPTRQKGHVYEEATNLKVGCGQLAHLKVGLHCLLPPGKTTSIRWMPVAWRLGAHCFSGCTTFWVGWSIDQDRSCVCCVPPWTNGVSTMCHEADTASVCRPTQLTQVASAL